MFTTELKAAGSCFKMPRHAGTREIMFWKKKRELKGELSCKREGDQAKGKVGWVGVYGGPKKIV